MKFKLVAMIIFMVSVCQAQIQVGTSEDDLISWRVAFISADSLIEFTVPGDVKIVTREDTVTLSWVQPLAREEFPPTILDSVDAYYTLDIYTNEVIYLPVNDDTSVAVEYSKTILLIPGDYWIAIRNCSISGKVSVYSYDPFPIRVKGKPGDPIWMPVSIDLIIKEGER